MKLSVRNQSAFSSVSRARRLGVESLEERIVFAAVPVHGMNLDQVVDYAAAWTFTDAFKASRDWSTLSYNTATNTESWSGGGTPVVDEKGWPKELQSWTNQQGQVVQQRLYTLMFREIDGNYPAGVYHAQWRGTGNVSFGYDASVIDSGTNPDGTRWANLNVRPSNEGIFLKINSMPLVDADPTDANPPAVDPIRDVHVWLPDYNGQSFKGQVWQPGASFSPFHPLFVERLAPFKTLRFMDWMKTNNSANEAWANRRGWDEANQTGDDGKGVALEYMVALANQVDADVWLNMPYKAGDDFIRSFAQFTRDNLEPGLDVNVEWSNEIWNSAGGFKTYAWITDQLGLAANAGLSRYQFAAREIKRDFDIWSDVFSQQPAGRLTRVVAAQASNAWVVEELLKNMEGKYDAVACTGYFGLNASQRAAFNASTTAAQVASAVLANVPGSLRALQTHRTLGQQYAAAGKTIKLYAYEAGQHADGEGNASLSYLPALHAAQTHPTMYEAYDDYVRGFYDIGGDLSMHYTYVSRNDKNGSWGALQAQNQPTAGAPKYRSLVEAVTGVAYVPEYTIAAGTAGEEFGQVPVTFRVTRSGDKSQAQRVSFQVTGGTAAASDYVLPGGAAGGTTGTVEFASGQASAVLSIAPANDATLEDAETLAVTLLPGEGYKVDGIATRVTATGTIVDDDAYMNAVLPIQNAGFETGTLDGWTPVPADNNHIAVPPTRPANAPASPVEGARYAWGGGASGTATGGAMNAGIAQTFSLAQHATAIDTGIAALNFTGMGAGWGGDFARLEVRYFNAAGAQVGVTVISNKANTDKTWTKMTADAAVPALARSVELRATLQRTSLNTTDAAVDQLAARLSYPVVPVVSVSATDATAGEPGTDKATFTVTRLANAPIDQPLVVAYTVSGTATSGTDFTPLPGTVTIAAGATSATVTVSPVDDNIGEPSETLVLTLAGRKEYALLGATSATATITDNDLPRVLITAVDGDAAEAGQNGATFVVERLTGAIGQPLTVKYTLGGTATNGSDYQALSGSVTIPADESVAAVSLVPINDTVVERDETVVLTLAADAAAYVITSPGSASATIVNDDFPRVTVTAGDANADEVGADPATFTFTRTGEFLDQELMVAFDVLGSAIAGEDYALPATGVTIPAGALSATVTVTPVADGETEGPETVVLSVLPGAGYTPGSPASATATIADEPVGPPDNGSPTVAGVFVSGTQWAKAFKQHLASTNAGDATYGYRVPAGAPLAVLPWANVNQVSVRFSEAVSVEQADLVVRGSSSAVRTSSGFTYDGSTFTATWTLPASVAGEKLLLDLDASPAGVTDLGGAALDGEWTGPDTAGAFRTGDGAAGGDFRFRMNVLPGDVNRNGSVTASDTNLVKMAQGYAAGTGRYTIFADVNASGTILANDVNLTRGFQGTALPAAEPTAPAGETLAAAQPGPTPLSAPAPTPAPAADAQTQVVTEPIVSAPLPRDPSYQPRR